MIPRDPGTYDPGAVPEWARETIAHIARECPEALAHHLDQVAETEATKRHAAQNPPPSPEDQRDLLRLVTIRTWQALAGSRPAPGLDPTDLQQAIYQAFAAGDGWHPVDRLCEGWLDLAPPVRPGPGRRGQISPGPTYSTPSAIPPRRRSGSASSPAT